MKIESANSNDSLCLDCDNHMGSYCRSTINGFPHRMQCASFNDALSNTPTPSIIQLPAPRVVVEPPQEVVVWQDEKKALALSYINIPKD